MVSIKKVLVIGDSCEDVYVYGSCNRLCPDAPVPVLIPKKTVTTGGMARNTYNNLKSLHSNVEFLTNPEHITKTRYVDIKTNQMLVRVDSEQSVLKRIENLQNIDLTIYDAIIISDYCKGFLEVDDIRYICQNNPNTFIDTKKILGDYCIDAKIIKINELEYQNNVNAHVDMSLFSDNLITTLGESGCRYKNKLYSVKRVEIKDMTGAGDTFIASLVYKYIMTGDMESAILFANECATIIVQQKGVNIIGDFLK